MKTAHTVSALLIAFLSALSTALSAQDKTLPTGVDPDEELLAIGLLDVTRKPYLANPRVERDSTGAIQKAVNDARDHGLGRGSP